MPFQKCKLRNEATGNEPELKDPETQEHGIDVDHHVEPLLHHQVNIELVRDEWLGLQFGGRTMFSLFIIFVLCCCWGDVVYRGFGRTSGMFGTRCVLWG